MSNTFTEGPKSYSLTDVQDWVGSSLKYRGRRKIAADVITRGVLDWWCTEGNLKYGEGATFGSLNDSFGYGFRPHAVDKDTKRKAAEDCRKHVKKVYSQYGSLLASFIMSIIINLIVRAVTELIIDWLFSYAGDKQ